MRHVDNEAKLGLQGIFMDTITSITSGPIDQNDIDFCLENIRGYGTWWVRAYAAVGPIYEITGESLARALGRTRIADDQEQEMRDIRNGWSDCDISELEDLDANYWPTHVFHGVAAKIKLQTLFRNLFITSRKKYIGLAPLTAQEGDHIVLLPGADVSYVLWHVHDQEYRVVGHCYTHGIMFEEAADSTLLQDIVLI
jgi:hypothetical protein